MRTRAAADSPPRALRAAVGARDATGAPTLIALPGPAAADRTPLYVPTADGSVRWVADILPDGTVKSDGARQRELAAVKRGRPIMATTDPAGRVIACVALKGPANDFHTGGLSDRPAPRAQRSNAEPSDGAGLEIITRPGGGIIRVY